MSQKLPLLPNIDHLRVQAKTFLDRCCTVDLNARSQVCSPRNPNPLEDLGAEIARQNGEIVRQNDKHPNYIREQNEMLSRTRSESYDGKDLKPCLTPAGEEHATLRQQPSESISPGRNYMGRVGLWLSQVGFDERASGEHVYGYANNNPGSYSDPSGMLPCPEPGGNPCDKFPHEAGYWDSLGGELSIVVKTCPEYSPSQLTAILFCIVENETRGIPGGFTFPTKGLGVQGPCQIAPGKDKDRLCGGKWRNSLKEHMTCCAKLLCQCLKNGGGNLVTGCGTTGQGKDRRGYWQVINQSSSGFDDRFRCCLIRRGIPNPSQNIPTVQTSSKK